MRHIIYVFVLMVFSTIGLNAQVLSAGDLAIVGFHSDNPDDFAMVALTDIPSGTQIKFTDNGWRNTNVFRTGEGTKIITLSTNVSCGTTMFVYPDDDNVENSTFAEIGTISNESGSFALSASGDQILIYQGSSSSPTFITAVNFESSIWQEDATNTNTSALPNGLTDGVNAVAVNEADNAAYDCSVTSGTVSDVSLAINNPANWNGSSTRGNITLPECNFSITGCGVPPTCSIDLIEVSILSGCINNGTINIDDDYAEAKIGVSFTGAPGMGTLNLGGDVIGSHSIPVGSLTGGMAVFMVPVPAIGGPLSISAFFSEDPGCSMINNDAIAPAPCSVVPDCSYPYFSEYIEGSNLNKCIEIYNPTASDISLDDYQVRFYFNGNTSPANTISFAAGAVLPAGGTYVFCNPSADDEFLNLADEIVGGNWYNGDDAIALVALDFEDGQDVNLDVIGQIGTDPGSSWNAGGVSTQNKTLRRAPFVLAGDNNGTDSFDPSAQWEAFDIDTEYGLGYHGSFCQEPSVPFGWNPFNIGCEDGSFDYDGSSDQWTITSNCFFPAWGQDDLTYAFQEKCDDEVVISGKLEDMEGQGWAGLMMRESNDPGSKYVWIYKAGSGSNKIRWSVRNDDNAIPTLKYTLAFFEDWLRIKRTGDFFLGFISYNGITWKQKFQAKVEMDDCIFAGPAVTSNVNGATTTGVFSNIYFGEGGSMMQAIDNGEAGNISDANIDRNNNLTEEMFELTPGVDVQEVTLRPNPVQNWLEIDLPKNFGEQVQLTIVDVQGRVIHTDQIENEMVTLAIDIAALNLSQGTYLLNLKSENQNVTRRFVKAQ